MHPQSHRYLSAILAAGSISKAAQALGISQPSLSQFVQRIEKDLGAEVFDRSTRPLALTESGRIFFEAEKRVAEIREDCRRAVQDINGGERGRVVVGASEYREMFFLTEVLPVFSAAHPGIEIALEEGTTRELEDFVWTGKTDVSLVISPLAQPGLEAVEIYEERLLLAVSEKSPLIEKALELGGFREARHFKGTNGGDKMLTGFGHKTVLSVADKVIDAVKTGALRHIFLVGGCDGAKSGRSYYADFVKATPKDTLVLTLACGKFRFNDLDIGDIGGIPRLLDMGQCNDAYSAIKVASALAEVFKCSVNDLPLSLILSWYEQKAVAILLTLLYLGIRDIRIGPSLPAFVSPAVLNVLVEKFGVKPITTPVEDLKAILG